MAKKEHPSTKSAKKSKGKKRKHEASDEDEVANKSIILSQETEESPPEKSTSKQLKRKSDTDPQADTEMKKSKTQNDQSSDEAEELYEPTRDELLECEKPENVKSVLTVRQKKKQKHQQRLDAQKDQLTSKEVTRNEEYLRKWKDSRDEWKFEKLRQISIQQSVFDESKINKEFWPIALEYLSGTKGAAKDKITKAAESIIDELDGEAERTADADPTSYTSSERYRRARELLQVFD